MNNKIKLRIIKVTVTLLIITSVSFSQAEKNESDVVKAQKGLLLRMDGSAEQRYRTLVNYSNRYNVDFNKIIESVYDTFVVRTYLNDRESHFYCRNAIPFLGLAGCQEAADFIKREYIYCKKTPTGKSRFLCLAVEAYLNLEPADLIEVLESAIIKNDIPVLARYQLSKDLIKFLTKKTYRNKALSKTYYDTFTNLVKTEIKSSERLGVIIELDEMLSEIDNKYKDSRQRLKKLNSIKQHNNILSNGFKNSHDLDWYNKKINEVNKRIAYLESIPDHEKTDVVLINKSDWE